MPKEDTQFKSQGVGVKNKQRPVSVLLPSEMDSIVRALPNRSDFIRQAIAEKLKKEGFLST